MAARDPIPCALSIAGSDSGGGAGIQADLKTFASLDVHGTTVVTCLTAQNPRGVRGIQAARPDMVRAQLEAVFAEIPPGAAKTGMLFSAAIIEVVSEFLEGHQFPVVVDPVMIATSGAVLLKSGAIRVLRKKLLPRATLITPNLDEAAFLLGRRLASAEDLREAARQLHTEYGCAVLVKGGHLRGLTEAIDIYRDGRDELLLTSRFVRGVSTHGTGCTYSAAIAGFLARGLALRQAVCRAKEYISQAIAQSRRVAGHDVLNSFWS